MSLNILVKVQLVEQIRLMVNRNLLQEMHLTNMGDAREVKV